ncbi:MAG: four helix bundle protein [Candidatus Uhrbacteria bacterium]
MGNQRKLVHIMFDLPVIQALYDANKSWHELVLKFPKAQRYGLGNKCGEYLLRITELALEAAAEQDINLKLQSINIASNKLDILKLLVRLCKDCKCISNAQYITTESNLQNIGKQIGGWINDLNKRNK